MWSHGSGSVGGAVLHGVLDATIITPPRSSLRRSGWASMSTSRSRYLVTVGSPGERVDGRRFGTRGFHRNRGVHPCSVGCAASVSLPMLVACALCKESGALMVPVGRLLVLGQVRRATWSAIAWLTWPALAAPVVAPILGVRRHRGLLAVDLMSTSRSHYRILLSLRCRGEGVPAGAAGLGGGSDGSGGSADRVGKHPGGPNWRTSPSVVGSRSCCWPPRWASVAVSLPVD